MFLTKYDPIKNLDSIWSVFDSDFIPAVRKFFDEEEDSFRLPRTNINEKEKEYILTMEMPGVSKKNVEVSVEGDTLTVEANQVEKLESEGLLRREIRAQKYRRCFQLGSKVDRDGIKAKMENGVLKLTLPKKAESVGRKIDIS